MNEAVVVLSRKGYLKTKIIAKEIASREHARKLWPLVTPDFPGQLVTWVSPIFENGKLIRRSHFRILPNSNQKNLRLHFENEEDKRQRSVYESPEHKKAKDLIALALENRLANGRAMPWYFLDGDASDFHLAGNILLGAEKIHKEYRVETAFGAAYRLDVAIVSKRISTKPLLLGGVEIERGHSFDGRKALIGKSQAFPLISIDITDMPLDAITPEWADRALTETTAQHEKGQRKTYIYLHDLLYPLYIQLPSFLLKKSDHQFLIFAKNHELQKLIIWIKKLAHAVNITDKQFSISLINAKSEQSEAMLINAGEVVGPDWFEVNADQCLRLTVDRPSTPLDQSIHFFHIGLAKLLLLHTDALVGYKYRPGILNEHLDEDIWIYRKWLPVERTTTEHRILPKRLAEPRTRLIEILQKFANGS